MDLYRSSLCVCVCKEGGGGACLKCFIIEFLYRVCSFLLSPVPFPVFISVYVTAAREEEEEQGEKHILEVGYEFIGLIARELLVGFIVKAVFIEGCMMIIALSVNGSRGCCGQAVNLLTRQLSSWLVQVGQIWIKHHL